MIPPGTVTPMFSSTKSAWAQSWMASFSQKPGWPSSSFGAADRLVSTGRIASPCSSSRSSLPVIPSRSEESETLRVRRASPSLRVRLARSGSLTRRCWKRPSSTNSLIGITDSTYSR